MFSRLSAAERLPGEVILAESPYRPFSVLIVTNRRLIGRRLFGLRFGGFSGSVTYGELLSVQFRDSSFLGRAPELRIEYQTKGGAPERTTIRFPGGVASWAGYDPKVVCDVIEAQFAATRTQPRAQPERGGE